MERKTKITNIVVIALAVTVVFMSIGFAAFSQNLNIIGTATVKPASWKVQFDNTNTAASLTTGSVTPTTNTITETAYSFEVTLEKPNDFFEANLTVKNAGTIDAELKSITMSGVDNSNNKYLQYTLTYDGVEYSTDTSGLDLPLAANATKSVKVRVAYVLPTEATDLPSTQQQVQIKGTLLYEAATDDNQP